MYKVIDIGLHRWLVIQSPSGRVTIQNVTTGYRDTPMRDSGGTIAYMFPGLVPRVVRDCVASLMSP